MMNNFIKGSFALLASRVFAGLNVNCTKYLLPLWIAPAGFVAIRLFFATIFFWVIAIFEKPDMSSLADRVRMLLLGGVAVFGYMTLMAYGITYTTPVNFAIFNATQPIWVFVISVVLCNERPTFVKVLGIVVGFVGVVVTTLSESSLSLASNKMLGNIMALSGSVLYAVYLLMSSALLRRVGNLVLLRYTFTGASVSAFFLWFFSGADMSHFFINWNPTAVAVLCFVLFFPTVISYLLVPIGIKYLKATVVSMFGYISLIVATIVSLFLGQDKFDVALLFSMLLICIGIYLVGVGEKVEKRVYNNDIK